MVRSLLGLVLTAAVTCSCAAAASPGEGPVASASGVAATPGPPRAGRADPHSRWAGLLAQLDRRRASAYAGSDPEALGAVYLLGSTVLRHDRAVLRSYVRRGVRLSGVRLELMSVRLLRRGHTGVWLAVVDRLARPTAHTAAGSVLLPQDLPTRWRVRLARTPAGWRIAAVVRLAG